jgi:hypothetical protein
MGMSKTAVTSFVIRFKQEQENSRAGLPWHGSIRHVQTNRETHFTDIQEALTFMAQFVRIDMHVNASNPHLEDKQSDNPERKP